MTPCPFSEVLYALTKWIAVSGDSKHSSRMLTPIIDSSILHCWIIDTLMGSEIMADVRTFELTVIFCAQEFSQKVDLTQ